MHHQRRIAAFVSFLTGLLLLSGPVNAASDILIVVTPTVERQAQGSIQEKAPTSFSDIITTGPEATGLINTSEALRRASSVDLSDYGGTPASPLTLRGSNFQQTLVTLDGIPLNPVTGDMVDISRYMMTDIDRIEIIKGSNSAAFGRSALGGVVNLVTASPTEADEYDFTASQGSYGYGLYHGHLSVRTPLAGILANLTHAFSDNDYRYEKDTGVWTRRENNDVENTTGLIKALLDIKGWQTSLMGNLISQENGSPGSEGSAGFLTPDDRVNFSQGTYLLETRKSLPDDQLIVFRTWCQNSRNHTESISFGNSITRLVDQNVSASYAKKLGPVTVTPGAEYLHERMNSGDYGVHSRSTASTTLMADIDIRPVMLSLRGRYDDSSDFDGEWSYHAGASWGMTDHVRIRTNVGTGYHEPTMGQLYAPSTWYTFIRNPDLKPERSLSWDIGPCVTFNAFGFSADYFLTDYRNLIKMDYPAPQSFTYVNVDKAKASGMEASAWVAPASVLKLSANYILTRYTYESGAYRGNDMKQKPPQVLNLQADCFPVVAGRDMTFSLSYQFRQGSYADEANTLRTDNRYILNAGAIVDVNRNATISFSADNLLDDRSSEYVDKTPYGTFWYPVPGRTYRVAVKVAL